MQNYHTLGEMHRCRTVKQRNQYDSRASFLGHHDVGELDEPLCPGRTCRRRPAGAAFEGEIRNFIQREAVFPDRQRGENPVSVDSPTDLNVLVQRVTAASVEQIDRVIFKLQGVRDVLRSEGERVHQDICGYAGLNHASAKAMKVIADSLEKWKGASTDPSCVRRKNR